VAKEYQKTAKDLAFDRERAKFRRQIRDLKEDLRKARIQIEADDAVIEHQNEIIKELEEQNRKLRELTGLSPEAIETILNDAKRTAEASENIKNLLALSGALHY
jgi:hypothetical protein